MPTNVSKAIAANHAISDEALGAAFSWFVERLGRSMNMLTEEQIERRVERHIDHLDRMFMDGQINRDTYDKAMRDLHEWAEAKSKEAERHQLYMGKGTDKGESK